MNHAWKCMSGTPKRTAGYLGDHRLRKVPDAHPTFGDVPRPLPFAFSCEKGQFVSDVSPTQVVSGREGRTCPSDDLDPHVGVGITFAERLKKLPS
jgi:hypothetical protein